MISENIHRRHLDATQRAVIAQELLPELEKQALRRKATKVENQHLIHGSDAGEQGRSIDLAGRMLGVGGATVERVKRVAREAPELIPAMRAGKLSASAAETEVRERHAKKRVGEAKVHNRDLRRREEPRLSQRGLR
ncbi:MAG: hypothetical protein ACRD2Z_13165 [Thermoanaerobaculia bacterium]